MDNDEATRLRRAITRLARAFNGASTDEGLTPTQAAVLGIVASYGPILIPEIARIENLNPSMTSRVVTALDERKFVHREPDPNDLRSARLSITAAGRDAHERIKAQRASAVRLAAEALGTEQHRALLRALPALEALSTQLD